MKSIVYILLAALLLSIVVSVFPKSVSIQKRVVTIQTVDNSPNSNLLNESCLIIKNRLKDYGLQSFNVSANTTQKTIDITLSDKFDLSEILPLILSKGKIEFYVTPDRLDAIKLIRKEDKLYSLLNISSVNAETENSSAIVGYCKTPVKSQVDSIIAKLYPGKPDLGIKYLWSERTNKDGNYILYLLKPQTEVDKSQILETVLVNRPDKTDNFDLMINFNKDGSLAWQSLSKNNIGKQVAIVIDNLVYCAPIVQGEINNGKCIISGNFSTKEITRLKSLISNAELPLEFKLNPIHSAGAEN